MNLTAAEPDCVFCHIIAGRAPAAFVYEDDSAVAFMDIRPVNAGHLLVVPRAHAASLADMDAASAAHLMAIAHRLDAALRASGLTCDPAVPDRAGGVNLFLADGEAAGQDVFHVHLHVFPRFAGDGVRITANWKSPGRDALAADAARIRAALASVPTA